MTVEGVERMNRRMRRLPVSAKRAAREAIGQGAQEIVDKMKQLAPRDSGKLRDSIKWTFGNAPDGSVTIGRFSLGGFSFGSVTDMRADEGLRATIYVDTDKRSGAYYGPFVEFGTEAGQRGGRASYVGLAQNRRGRTQRRTHPGTRAQPFFWPAYRSLRRRVRGRITRAINRALKRWANPNG